MSAEDFVDAEILPSETPTQALVRRERAREAPVAVIEVDFPNNKMLVGLSAVEYGKLQVDQLYVGFYNLAGVLPDREDFFPAAQWEDEHREQIGMPPKKRKLLRADNSAPLSIDARLAWAPLKQSRTPGVLTADCQMDKTGWVTHFAVGTKKDGIIAAGEFDTYTPTQKGNGFSFGLRLTDLKLLEPKAQRRNLEIGGYACGYCGGKADHEGTITHTPDCNGVEEE